MKTLLKVEGISKAFNGVSVLKGASFTLKLGEVMGLVGENGAGKSTLMNILGGTLQPDAGDIWYSENRYKPSGPIDAEIAGIAVIHQELNLFQNLSIAENLFITRLPKTRWLRRIDRGALARDALILLEEVGLNVDPERLVDSLSAGERQLVEIAKAVGCGARVLLFDEPTTSLSFTEKERFLSLVERLKTRGVSMIYISHALGEVFRLCDQLLVMRDGESVAEGPTAAFTQEAVVSLMIGRTLSTFFPPRLDRRLGESLLEVRALTRKGSVNNVSFELAGGEIVGLSGLMGAGRSELARVVFGLDSSDSGDVLLKGASMNGKGPVERIARGLAFITENRQTEGLCLDASIAENMSLVALRAYSGRISGVIDSKRLGQVLETLRAAVCLDFKASMGQAVATLSGGNQQKIVLAKWLLSKPEVLILDEPTRGIDVGAKFEIYRIVQELAAQGRAVLLISSELEELIGVCDRIMVMRGGCIVDNVPNMLISRERLLMAALGTSVDLKGAQ